MPGAEAPPGSGDRVVRSVLSVPGVSERLVEKALAAGADEVVIDLEDAVSESEKATARRVVIDVLRDRAAGGPRITVRVNAPGSEWANDDLLALARLDRLPDAVMVPKVESSAAIAYTDLLLRGAEAAGRPPIAIQALIESAAGLMRLAEIAVASPRLEALVIGYADLAADLGREPSSSLWQAAQEQLLWTARAHGLRAVDGPWLGVGDDDGFRASVAAARSAGFDAKWVLHPRQVRPVAVAYAPDARDIVWAAEVLEVLAEAGSRGGGVAALNGQMIDEAVAVRARAILAGAPAVIT